MYYQEKFDSEATGDTDHKQIQYKFSLRTKEKVSDRKQDRKTHKIKNIKSSERELWPKMTDKEVKWFDVWQRKIKGQSWLPFTVRTNMIRVFIHKYTYFLNE